MDASLLLNVNRKVPLLASVRTCWRTVVKRETCVPLMVRAHHWMQMILLRVTSVAVILALAGRDVKKS